jgi:hypothetical protein
MCNKNIHYKGSHVILSNIRDKTRLNGSLMCPFITEFESEQFESFRASINNSSGSSSGGNQVERIRSSRALSNKEHDGR